MRRTLSEFFKKLLANRYGIASKLYHYLKWKTHKVDPHGCIIHNTKVCFIHNPKVAGTSVRKFLGVNDQISHYTPSFLVDKKTWEDYFIIVAVREPISRFISSYNYHTSESYDGFYLRKFPDLKSMSVEEYFDRFKKEPFIIMPQVNYVKHALSQKVADYVIRFENLNSDIEALVSMGKVPNNGTFPALNRATKNNSNILLSKPLFDKLLKYYAQDYAYFNYKLPLYSV